MEDLGFHPEEIIDIFRIMSAVLKLGNINFIPTTNMDGTDGCAISNDYGKSLHLKNLAQLGAFEHSFSLLL